MDKTKTDKFNPLSARTNARQKMRLARRKATLLQSKGDYSKFKHLCDIVQRKCGLTESQVRKELGRLFISGVTQQKQ